MSRRAGRQADRPDDLKLYKPPTDKPVGGYIRVSRVGGRAGEGYISPDDQHAAISAYAKQLRVEIPDWAWYEDEDYSGKNLRRPAWEELMRQIETGQLGGVIVMQVDRFARTVPAGAREIERIVDEHKAFFGSSFERMDAATPQGRYMLQQFLNNAELQLNTLRSGWVRAKERAIRRGAHIGPTPLGLDRVPKHAAERAGCLIPKKEWVPIVQAVFERAAATNDGMRLLAKWANVHAPRPDDKQWTGTTIGHLLRNRVYRGEVRYISKREPGDAEYFEPLINPEAHESMVSERLWRDAQREPGVQRVRSDSDPINLLVGLVRCAGCRHRMAPSRGGKNIRVYRCRGASSAGTCPAPATIKGDALESWTRREVRSQLKLRVAVAVEEGDSGEALAAARETLAEAREAQRQLATDPKARRLMGDDLYYESLETHAQAVSEAERVYQAESSKQSEAQLARIDWETMDPELEREVLAGAVDAVYVRRGRGLSVGERAVIVWRGELDDDVPARGKSAGPIRSFAWPQGD